MTRTLVVLTLLVGACDDGGDKDGGGALAWYTTCGDPACSGYSGPFEGVEACADEELGAACTEEGATCDPVDDCNALVICAAEDPKEQEGGCPISLRAAKQDIRYLSEADRAGLRDALLDVRLARYQYLDALPGAPDRLGFVIDDLPDGSPAVLPSGGRVDVYGFTSMTVAAVQAQQAELAALRAEVAALRAEVEALRTAP